MTNLILSDMTASITELKANPMKTIESACGEPIAILNHNKPAFYCIPAERYEALMDMLDDMVLADIVRERRGQEEVEVDIDDI